MEGLIIIGIIVFIIWIIIKSYSNGSSKNSNSTKTTYEPKYDYEKEQERKREEEKRKERERIRKENEERQRNWKTDWQEFQRVIDEKNITVLYHFTDRANLQSILNNGGLYSWKYCEDNNIRIPFPGGDEWSRRLDIKYNLENYVRLCFTRNHPMMYVAKNEGRIRDPVILEIDPEVIYWKDTLFSDMNATRNGHTKGGTIQDFRRIKFEVVKQQDQFEVPEDLRKYYQAEVMIKEHIPLQFIRNINDLIP